jgi:chorismate mutase/GNAT superfamily N-acetyltransferase
MPVDLKTLGDQLKLVDQEIMNLVMERMQLARQVGFCKYLRGEEISRSSIEDERIVKIRQYAESIGLNSNFASSLLYSLIDESCKEQMIQLQRGKLLVENIHNLQGYNGTGIEIPTSKGTFKAFTLATKALSAQDREYVFDMIYPVAKSAFGQSHSEKFANDVRVHGLDHSEILLVQNDEGRAIAFRVWDVFEHSGRPIIYLAGMCVSLEYQQCGFGGAMIRSAIDIVEQKLNDVTLSGVTSFFFGYI